MIANNVEQRVEYERLRRERAAGEPLKVYRYGPYGEVEVEKYPEACIMYNTVTGWKTIYTDDDKEAAFGYARLNGERYAIIGKRMGGE